MGDSAIPPIGRPIRTTPAYRNATASMTDTRRLPAFVTYTRAPDGSTASENGEMPTLIVFTVRMPTTSTSASLRVPLTT